MAERTFIEFTDSCKAGCCSAIEYRGRKLSFRLGEKIIARMPHLKCMLLLMVALALALPVLADYYDGLREWDAGRHGEALVKWQAAAMEGDARSMMALGRLFVV